MQKTNIYVSVRIALDDVYLAKVDPDQPWSRPHVLLAIAAASKPDTADRYSIIAHRAIQTLPIDIREAFLAEYDIPRHIMDADAPWPEAAEVEDFGSVLGVDLEQSKLFALERVLWKSDQVRKYYITPLTGQIGIYIEKEKEAVEFRKQIVEPADLSSEFPHLAAESAETGRTPTEVADIYLARAATLRAISGQLEGVRVATVEKIETATDLETIQTAETYFDERVANL